MRFTGSVAVVAVAACSVVCAQENSSLPLVDLGYEVHQAIEYSETGDYYNFSNIRYAQPPVGDLRFAHPKKPAGRNPEIQNGSVGTICPQASPAWQLIGAQFAGAWASGNGSSFNYTQAKQNAMSQVQNASGQALDPRVSEDCLFLDVFAPRYNFDAVRGYLGGPNGTAGNVSSAYRNYTSSGNSTNSTAARAPGAKVQLAPVIIWIYGGGYVFGSKTAYGSPAGLMNRGIQDLGNGTWTGVNGTNSSESVVWVAMNYRLGAFGWLGGPSMQQEGGVANAALYDQRLAIQWVREKIHLFGGDPNRITVMGESAGGGSIMHQITAYGGMKGVNFQRAIVQSPGWLPITSQFMQDNTTQTLYQMCNVSSLAELRNLNSSVLMRANALQIAGSPYSSYTYGPTVDGVFVTSQPGLALMNGQFAKDVEIMAGHNTNEGVLFAPPMVKTDADIAAWMYMQYPNAPPSVGSYILNNVYPGVYDGSHGYTTPVDRVVKMITEQVFGCNTNYLARAKDNQTYNYEFQAGSALHGADLLYTFYNGGNVVDQTVATTLQSYITQFAATGNPNRPGLPNFPIQGTNSSMLGLNSTSIRPMPDDMVNWRCKWWQKYLYT